MDQFLNYFKDHLDELYRAGAVLVITFLLAKTISFSIRKYIESIAVKLKRKMGPGEVTRIRVIIRIIVAFIYILGFFGALYQFDSISKIAATLFASAGIIGVLIGIAAQSTLGSVFSSFIISISQPFRIGDIIEIDSNKGEVIEITIFYTKIRIDEKKILVIPNKKMMEVNIINYSLKK